MSHFSSWLAVDLDGHLAAFDPYGAMPVRVVDETNLSFILDLPSRYALLDRPEARHVDWPDIPEGAALVAFVGELGDLAARLAVAEVRSTGGRAVRFARPEEALLAELHARGACQWCDVDPDPLYATCGVYEYNSDGRFAAPYQRVAVPAKPIDIADVPPAVRIRTVRFPGRFATARTLQPAEHWRCRADGAGWLATDGKTVRPFAADPAAHYADEFRDEVGAAIVILREPLEVADCEFESPAPARGTAPDWIDTTVLWLGVDRDDCVAVFCGTRDAATPELVLGDSIAAALDAVRGGLHDGEVLLDRPDDPPDERHLKDAAEGIAFVDNASSLVDLMPRLGGKVVRATTGQAIRFAKAEPAAFAELHARGACAGCTMASYVESEWTRRGFFRYDGFESLAAPYARQGVPEAPIKIAALPPELRVRTIRFGGRFAAAPALQPAEHWKCVARGPGWLSLDRKTVRPLPGAADDAFTHEVVEWRERDPQITANRIPHPAPLGELESSPPPPPNPAEASKAASKAWWKFW